VASKDDLVNQILNKPKPQPEKAEAFSLDKDKNDEVKKEEQDPLQYRRVRKVPYLKKWPTCGICKERLLGDRFGWFTECEDGEHWWWCIPCMEECDCYATEKEIKNAKKERRSRAR